MSGNIGQPVAIADIAQELKKLWEADQAATNASLMNFAIYSEEEGSLERNALAIQALTREHACRAILVEMQRGHDSSSAQAWVTAHCHLAHGKKSVCCEQLAFLLKGKAIGRMRNTVFSNLSSDLPLVFWWQGALSDHFEERLYHIIDRLIVDSAEWPEPAQGFAKLRDAVADSRCRIAVQDLEWTRSFHFRMGLASLFDDPVALAMLGQTKTVEIVGAPQNLICQKLLAAWLATQAHWELQGLDGSGMTFKKEGKTILLSFMETEGAPLSRVELSDGTSSVRITRKSTSPHLDLALLSPSHELRQVAPADPIKQVDLVADQLSRGGKNSLFRKTWPTFFAMLDLPTKDC